VRLAREAVLGILAIAVAGGYYREAARIQKSMLADAVGADGVPRLLAVALGIVGVLLVVRGVVRGAAGAAPGPGLSTHLRAAGLLAILAGFVIATPVAGYPLAIAGLIAAVALYAGARPGGALAAIAVAGAAVFWLVFGVILGVPLPAGVLRWG
jgi:hypothetical protein